MFLPALLLSISQRETPIFSPDAKVAVVVSGYQFLEGPVWTRRGTLVWSDIPADTMYEMKPGQKPTVFRHPSHNSNGNTLDKQGCIVTCEHGLRRVTRQEKNGSTTVLADQFEGKKLNSPNDCVVGTNGSIYFTDPPYGVPPGEHEELGFAALFRITPAGKLEMLFKDFRKPNGIAFSPDEKILYVDDTERDHIKAFDVQPDGSLTNERVYAILEGKEQGGADGMRVDVKGNVYCTGKGGVEVFNPAGRMVGRIKVPETTTNMCFGDRDGKTLYITAGKSLYSVRVNIRGVR